MNGQRDVDAIIATWLDDGPVALPTATRRAISVGIQTQPRARRMAILGGFTMLPLNRIVAATVVVIAVGAGSVLLMSNRSSDPGVGGPAPSASPSASPPASETPPTSASPSPAPTVTPSPTQPPVSFTSPLYGYTVSWPLGGGWDVTPARVPWPEGTSPDVAVHADWFVGPAGAYQDWDDVYVEAQPVPEGMTPAAWQLDYAERVEASGRDCKGPAEDWTDAVVGSLTIRRLDVLCQSISFMEVAFVVDGTGYIMAGNSEVITLFLETFQPSA